MNSQLSNVMYLTRVEEGFDSKRCHICGKERPLTWEHVPPRSAYNECDSLWERMTVPTGAPSSARKYRARGGFKVQTLCSECNSGRCARYAEAYVRFVRHLVETPKLFGPSGRSRLVSIPSDTLLLAKEIATMILAVEPEGLGGDFAALRQFVLDPEGIVHPKFRILAFLVPSRPNSGTIQPYHGRVDTFAPGFGFHGGEISRFPFGFVYASEIGDAYQPKFLADITHWFWTSAIEQRTHATVNLHCRLTVINSIVAGARGSRELPQSGYIPPNAVSFPKDLPG